MLKWACVMICCGAMAGVVAADARTDFLHLIDRPRVDADVKIGETAVAEGAEELHLTFASDASDRVPVVLLKTADAGARRLPMVIALHGTGGTMASERHLLGELAKAGFLAVSFDAPHHGARTKEGKGTADYDAAILHAWRANSSTTQPATHPFFYDTVWDVMRLIDYLQTRNDVDPDRIGLMGISKGGVETYLATAVDPRVAAAVPCIGVQSFRWAIEHDSWHSRIGTIQPAFDAAAKEAGVDHPDGAFVQQFYDRVAPGLAGEFDGPAMLPLIAPRPLMTINGDSDARTPLPGLKECTDAADKAYAAAGAAERFKAVIEPHTAHKVTPEAEQDAVRWFSRWLKAEQSTATRP